MNDFSQFSPYHPAWEGRDFTQAEYTSLLKDLSKKKAHEAFLIHDGSIKVVNAIVKIWETIKGWLGFNNQTDVVKVNYEFLKLLRYGETHHYLNYSRIKPIIQNLFIALKEDKTRSYEKITTLIEAIFASSQNTDIAPFIDREVNLFYQRHAKHLKEAPLSHLISQYLAPASYDAARVAYHQSKIYASEERLLEAIQNLKNALHISPNRPYWQLDLAELLLKYAETLPINQALKQYEQALKTFHQIQECSEITSIQENASHIEQQIITTNLKLVECYAHLYSETGDHGLALKELEKAYRINPTQNLSEGIQKLAHTLATSALNAHQYSEAIVYLKKIHSLSPTDRYALSHLTQIYVKQANWKEAGVWSKLWTTAHPTDYEAFLVASSIAFELNKPEAAAKHAKTSLQLAPNNPEAIFRLFELTGEIDLQNIDGLNVLDKKQQIKIYHHLAFKEINARSFLNAIALLEKAKTLDPKNILTLTSLAECYASTQQTHLAEHTWKTLENLGYHSNQSQLSLAKTYLKQGKFSTALPIFQQQNHSSPKKTYQKEIHDCYVGLASTCEKTQPLQAFDYYKQSLSLASNTQKQTTAALLLNFGHAILKNGERSLASKCFLLAFESLPSVAKLPKEQLGEAYACLARENWQEKKYKQASKLYQKALLCLPNHIDLILESAQYEESQGNFDRTASLYRTALNLKPYDSHYRQKLIKAELAAGNKYYEKGIHDPEHIRLTTVNFIAMATSSEFPHAKKIQKALMSWLGKNFGENYELSNLAIQAKTPAQIESDAIRACELVEKAYDGLSWYHMKPSEMPEMLIHAIQELREKTATMHAYYATLQQKTKELIKTLKSTSLAEQFAAFPLMPKLQDLRDSLRVKEEAKNLLQLIAKAKQRTPLAINQSIEDQTKILEELLQPAGWMHLAIRHYCNALELNPHYYGDHCNKLIDAYIKAGDSFNAIVLYEKLKKEFPTAPLKIDYTAYTKLNEVERSQTLITNEQIVEGLIHAADQKKQEQAYEEAIAIYKQASKIATPQQMKKIAKALLHLGDALLNGTFHQYAIQAYETLAPHLNSLHLQNSKLNTIFTTLGHAKQSEAPQESLNYYKQALSIVPNQANVHAEMGNIHISQNEPEQALNAYQKASSLEPNNLNYVKQLAHLEIAMGDRFYIQASLYHTRELLRNFIQFVTNTAPYAHEIKSSLGYRLGTFSGDNHSLSNLGKKSATAEEIVEDMTKALILVKKAYDGKSPHKNPEDMPEDLIYKLEALETQLVSLQFSMQVIPKECEDAKLSARHLTDSLQQAITYYEKANIRFPEKYGSHYNRLVDALVLQEEPLKAFNLYRELKKAFPGSPLQINPIAYLSACDVTTKKNNFSTAFKIIESGLEEFPNNRMLKKRKSDLYFHLGTIEYQANQFNAAAILYTLATKCGVNPNLNCYVNLAKIYISAIYEKLYIPFNIESQYNTSSSELKHLEFINFNPNEADFPNHLQAAAAYLKKAADLDPKNAELRFQLGRLAYHAPENLNFDVLPYLQEAVDLEPNNIPYSYALLMTASRRLSISDPQVTEAHKRFKKIGGDITAFDVNEYWNSNNPYGFSIREN